MHHPLFSDIKWTDLSGRSGSSRAPPTARRQRREGKGNRRWRPSAVRDGDDDEKKKKKKKERDFEFWEYGDG